MVMQLKILFVFNEPIATILMTYCVLTTFILFFLFQTDQVLSFLSTATIAKSDK